MWIKYEWIEINLSIEMKSGEREKTTEKASGEAEKKMTEQDNTQTHHPKIARTEICHCI